MPKHDPIAARRLLVAQVRDLATGVGLAIRTVRSRGYMLEEADVSDGAAPILATVAPS